MPTEDVTFISDIIFTSLRPDDVLMLPGKPLGGKGGGGDTQAQTLPPFTSYVRHHDSGKNRHSIISTKAPIYPGP